MATIPLSSETDRGEARFFFAMACIMATANLGGFALNLVTGRSGFALPLLVHVHAWIFIGWVALYLVQNGLVFSGNVTLHRKLGWLSVIWIPLMIVFGLMVHRWSMQHHGGPAFVATNQFMIANPMQLFAFAGLATAAVAARRNTGWHRRLMFCAFADLSGAGIGRLMPLPYLIPAAWWANVGATLLFPLVGMLADKRRYGAIHPAWFWGMGTVIVAQLVADLIAFSPLGYRFTEWFLAGTPGAERPTAAFP